MKNTSLLIKFLFGYFITSSIVYTYAQVSESNLLLRLNCGGNDVMVNSKLYEEDLFFDNGGIFSNFDNNDILITTEDVVYKTERTQNGGFSYTIPITNGTYTVRLHFAEIFFGAPGKGNDGVGKRVFSVDAEGNRIISSLDLNEAVGTLTAHIEEHQVAILDGEMNLNFIDEINQPKVSAIEIYGSGTITRPPDTSCEWETLSDSSLPRLESQSIVVNNLLYVFSGFTNGLKITGLTESYDAFLDEWTTLAPMPTPVTHMGIVSVGNQIWILGGFIGDHPGIATDLVQIYNIDTNSWSTGTQLPNARGSLAAAKENNSIHIIGGLLPDRVTDVGEHYVFNTENTSLGWQQLADMPEPRNHHSAAVVNGKLYAIGGQRGHDMGTDDQKFLHEYDPNNDSWTRKADLVGDRSHFEPGTIVYDGKIIIVGGRNGGQFFKEITEYDPINDVWTELCTLPDKVLAPVAKVIGTELIVANGGINGTCCPTTRTLGVDLFSGVTLNSLNHIPEIRNNISAYPNPSEGTIKFRASNPSFIFSVQVFDANGSLVYENNEVFPEKGIDLRELHTGMYFLKIITGKEILVESLMMK